MTVPFAAHFKLSTDMSPKTDEEMEHMSSIPYSSVVGSIMAKMSDTVVGYVDSHFAGDLDKKRSLTGYLFTLSVTAISWKATLQAIVALSTIEAEYMALAEAVKKVL
ncbi:hypothetical protein GH714_032974 [Hevea brasiliensis]|uniref:Reverse transcriptase Ty1/copia-type domain-containing protein n=1 Tax=Hevea brasiliensis TaxID=3981 RepID=A0A6A6LR88_HEVBR|nr:hypothetical protein GH714_032974 [Hevea brasiliensis]